MTLADVRVKYKSMLGTAARNKQALPVCCLSHLFGTWDSNSLASMASMVSCRFLVQPLGQHLRLSDVFLRLAPRQGHHGSAKEPGAGGVGMGCCSQEHILAVEL